MVRGAEHEESPKRQITLFIVKAAAVLTLAAAPYLIFCGLPLAGLPDADEVTRVEITRIDDGLFKMRDECKRHRARAQSRRASALCAVRRTA